MVGVTVPLHSAEHFYVVTDQFEGVHPDLPILRDPDGYTYFKEEVGGLVVGGFEPEAKPWVAPDEIPYPFEFQLLDEDWEHFSVLMDNARAADPGARARPGSASSTTVPRASRRTTSSSSARRPSVRGFFVGAGFNSVGIASAGGAGRALAEWIVEGEPTRDLTASTSAGSRRSTATTRWLRDRVGEVLGLHYAVPWPNRELRTGAAVRRSPVHHRAGRGGTPASAAEDGLGAGQLLRACRRDAGHRLLLGQAELAALVGRRAGQHPDGVAVFDQTSFSKYLVSRAATPSAALQWLCTADVDVPVGQAVYTGMLNARGTYESDVTVTRVGRGRVPDRLQRRDHRARPGLHPAQPPRRARRPSWST